MVIIVCSRFPHVNFRLLGALSAVCYPVASSSFRYVHNGRYFPFTYRFPCHFPDNPGCQVFLPFQLTWSCSLGRFASPILRYPAAACSPFLPCPYRSWACNGLAVRVDRKSCIDATCRKEDFFIWIFAEVKSYFSWCEFKERFPFSQKPSEGDSQIPVSPIYAVIFLFWVKKRIAG